MLLAAATVSVAVACSGDDVSGGDPGTDRSSSTEAPDAEPRTVSDRFVETGRVDAEEPAAMAVTPDGSLLIGERRTGRVLSVPAEELSAERPVPTEFARLDVATEGQQGLLGLAATPDGQVYAGMTRPGPGAPRQVVVSVLTGGDAAGGDRTVAGGDLTGEDRDVAGAGTRTEPVWIGPVAATGAIGGRLAVLPDGRLLFGLGDFLRAPADSFDAQEPYSKLLALDPTGPPDQEPEVLSSGWNNPFAFTVAPGGAVWVADNSPGDSPERIGRGDGQGSTIALSPPERAPSGLAALSDDELVVCGVLSGVAELIEVRDGRTRAPSQVLADPCRLGVVALPGGGLAVAVDDGVRLLAPRTG